MAPDTRVSLMAFAVVVAVASCATPPPPREVPAAAPQQPIAAPPAEPKPVAPAAAANMANNCFTCHGPAGRSPGTIPSLAPLSAAEIIASLKQFKSGERSSTVMGRHAKGYADFEIEALANYIAGLNKK